MKKFVGKEWLISKTADILLVSLYGNRQEERIRHLKRIGKLDLKMFEELTF